jgi:chromosome partitioning protein
MDERKPIVMAIGNQKGGVGKTTTMVNLGEGLAREGNKVLAVDADPQSNATTTIIKELGQREIFSIAKALESEPGTSNLSSMACPTKNPNLDIVPNTIKCMEWERTVTGTTDSVLGFTRLIKNDEGIKKYDYLIIDTPPNIGTMVNNALMISDFCIIPVPVSDQYALDGLATFIGLLQSIHQQNDNLQLLGVLLTKFDSRAPTHKKNLEKTNNYLLSKGIPVFKTVIRNNIDINKAQSKRKTIFEFDKSKYGAIDYSNLSMELIETVKERLANAN